MDNRILCLSGGMDSVIAWYYLEKPPCVYFDTGTPYSKKEINAINSLGIPCIIDTSLNFSDEKGTYIPHRNLLFASRASQYGTYVIMAGLKDDKVEDKTEEAFLQMSMCLSAIGKSNVVVTSPFWKYTKAQICAWFLVNVPDAEAILHKSISCYNGKDGPCYNCESCFRKACAMHSAGMFFPFSKESDLPEQYMSKALLNHYDPDRNDSIMKFIFERELL